MALLTVSFIIRNDIWSKLTVRITQSKPLTITPVPTATDIGNVTLNRLILMPIYNNLDLQLVKKKMSLTELSERVDITMSNLFVLKQGKA
jgi:hypothetical protein